MKEQRNTWAYGVGTKPNAINMSMFTGEEMSEEVYRGYKREYSYGMMGVGSPCNTKCFYCTQYWNPPNMIPNFGNWLTIEQIKHFMEYLPVTENNRKLVNTLGYGHAVSNGEFFSHPQSAEILELLKNENVIVQGADTNGMSMTEEDVKLLKYLAKDSDEWSLSWPQGVTDRTELFGIYLHITNLEKTEPALTLLDKYEVPYQIVIVPTRKELENGRIERWVAGLQKYNPTQIQLSPPSYTKYTPEIMQKLMNMTFEEMWELIFDWQKKYPSIPINSSTPIASTSETYIPSIEISLDWLHRTLKDSHPSDYLDKKILFLTSEAVESDFEPVVKKCNLFDEYVVKVTKNNTFGGNIKVGGLLLCKDYEMAIEEVLETGYRPHYIVMSKSSFFHDDEDLIGLSPVSLAEKYGIDVLWC